MKYQARYKDQVLSRLYFRHAILLCLFGFRLLVLYAQPRSSPVNIRTLTVEDGLSQSVVYAVAQDGKGLIWIATFNGLDRYDGYSFVHFRHQPADSFSISSGQVTALYCDSRNRLWAGTADNGLNYYDPVRRRFHYFFPGQKITGIAEDATGHIYITCNGNIVRITAPGQNGDSTTPVLTDTTAFRPAGTLPGDDGTVKLFMDSHKNLFATTPAGLFTFSFSTARKIFVCTKLLSCRMSATAELPELKEDRRTGKYYLITADAVLESADSRFLHPVQVHSGIPYCSNTFIDDSSRLWYTGHETNYLFNLVTREDKVFASGIKYPGYDFGHLTVRLQDAAGAFWLTTAGKGLIVYSGEENRFHSLLSGQFIEHMAAIDSSTFIVSGTKLVYTGRDGAAIKTLSPAESEKYAFLGFPADDNGIRWRVSSDTASLVGFHPGNKVVKIRPIPYAHHVPGRSGGLPLPGQTIFSDVYPGYLFMDREGCLWLYCRKGFLYYNTRQNRFQYRSISGFSSTGNDTKKMYEDASGTVWISISGGVCTYNKNTEAVRLYPGGEGNGARSLAGGNITSFCDDPADPGHTIWIGTRNGLSRMDKASGACRNFTEKEGLPGNVICSILPDRRENLWISTANGLCRLATGSYFIHGFTAADGLQGSEFNRDAALALADGTFVFGGTNGITYFHPGDIKSAAPPQTAITDWQLFGKSRNLAASGEDIMYAKEISITYACNNLSFSFAGADYSRKQSLQYRYRLSSFDHGWNYAGTGNEATYTNLDPGDYTFEAQASSEGGIWGKKSDALVVHVLPLWWQTWYFRFAGFIAGAFVVYALYRNQLRQAVEIEQVRNSIARDLHDEIGSALSTISIYSSIAQQQSSHPEANPFLLIRKINENATQVMEAMNDIVWSINTRNDTFGNIFSRMQEHAVQLLEAKGYTPHFDFEEGLVLRNFGPQQRKNLYLIYKEALNNIVKYAGGRNVWIQVRDRHSRLRLNIRDDGNGFDTDATRSGNGLINMQSRAASLGGEITIASGAGMGTEIIVSVPYK